MKLLYCPRCKDIFRLFPGPFRACICGQSSGRYMDDGIVGEIQGEGVPLGFANGSFAEALRNRPHTGHGERFTAFVIPRSVPRIRKVRDKPTASAKPRRP